MMTLGKLVFTSACVASLSFITGCGIDGLQLETKTVQGANGPITYLAQPGYANDKIIGANDLVKVTADGSNLPAKYRPLLDAFGLISMGCSATHIGNGLVLTAGHCFQGTETVVEKAPCPGVTVSWGVRGGRSPYMVSKCTQVLSYQRSATADYAIFKVSPAPAAVVEVELGARPSVGTSVTIFGHPQGRPLEWSQVCDLQRTPSNVPFNLADFVHQCDTEPGNSGSTIIDDTTLKVIGIHDGGIAPWNYGTLLSSTPLSSLL